MPKFSPLGQKLWPTGRGQTHRHTDTQTDRQRKQTLRTPFFEKIFFDFRFSFKGAVRYFTVFVLYPILYKAVFHL